MPITCVSLNWNLRIDPVNVDIFVNAFFMSLHICLLFIANARFRYSIWFFDSLVLYQVFRWRNESKHTPYIISFRTIKVHTHTHVQYLKYIYHRNKFDRHPHTKMTQAYQRMEDILRGNMKQKTISSKFENIQIFLDKYYAICTVTWYGLHSGYFRISLLYFSTPSSLVLSFRCFFLK